MKKFYVVYEIIINDNKKLNHWGIKNVVILLKDWISYKCDNFKIDACLKYLYGEFKDSIPEDARILITNWKEL